MKKKNYIILNLRSSEETRGGKVFEAGSEICWFIGMVLNNLFYSLPVLSGDENISSCKSRL